MDEFMLMEYLKSKGIGNMSEHEFVNKFKEFMQKHSNTSYMRYHNDEDDFDYDVKYKRGMSPMKRSQLGYWDMYAEYPEYGLHSERMHDRPYRFNRMHDDMYEYSDGIRRMREIKEEHFDISNARYVVSEMHHSDNGREHTGEKYSIEKAKEVKEKYRGIIPSDVTIADIYVAINAQYHDYCNLFKSWFGSNIDSKIIESAIIFWFKDVDYKKGFKLMEYFKEF